MAVVTISPKLSSRMRDSSTNLGAWDIMGAIQQAVTALPQVLSTAATYSLQKSQLAAQRLQVAADAQAQAAAAAAAQAAATQAAADRQAQAAADAQAKLAATKASENAAKTASDYMPLVLIGGGVLAFMLLKGKRK